MPHRWNKNHLRQTAWCRRPDGSINDDCQRHLVFHDCRFAHTQAELRCGNFARTGRCSKANCKRRHCHLGALPSATYQTLTTTHPLTVGDRPDVNYPDYRRSIPRLKDEVPAELLSNVASSAHEAQSKKGNFGLKFLTDRYIIVRWGANQSSTKTALAEAWRDEYQARQLLHDLLSVEVSQSISDVRQYDLPDAEIIPESFQMTLLYRINCEGLAEKRPSVLRGDKVTVRDNTDLTWHHGFVFFVNLDHVLVNFGPRFRRPPREKTFLVIFTITETNFRKQFDALNSCPVFTVGYVLNHCTVPEPDDDDDAIETVGAAANLNDEQLEAVQRVAAPLTQGKLSLCVVHGPPGTGKTTTLVAAILHLLSVGCRRPDRYRRRILVVTPSNEAANLVMERIVTGAERLGGARLRLSTNRHIRVAAHSLDIYRDCSEIIRPHVKKPEEIGQDDFAFENVQLMVATMMTAGSIRSLDYPKGFFDYVIVDEAGQCTETELMVPLTFANPTHGTRIVLAGDHKQLGPILRSMACQGRDFGKSTLERLMKSPLVAGKYSTLLVNNYRAHPSILDLYNTLTYENKLVACADRSQRELFVGANALFPNPDHPMAFIHVRGKEDRQNDSPSWFNKDEADIVIRIIEKVLTTTTREGTRCAKLTDIVVLSPYLKQCKHLRDRLWHEKFSRYMNDRQSIWYAPGIRRNNMPIRVCSVETFQGREAKVIIMSCVRSKEVDSVQMDVRQGIGFLKQPQRLNVAISRPISALFMVGNIGTLSCDENWAQLIHLLYTRYGAVADSSSGQRMSSGTFSDLFAEGRALARHLRGDTATAAATATTEVEPSVDPEWTRTE